MLQCARRWRVVGVATGGRGSSWSGGEASRGRKDRSSFPETSPNPPESTSTTQPQPQPPTYPIWCLSSPRSVLITWVNSPLACVPGFCTLHNLGGSAPRESKVHPGLGARSHLGHSATPRDTVEFLCPPGGPPGTQSSTRKQKRAVLQLSGKTTQWKHTTFTTTYFILFCKPAVGVGLLFLKVGLEILHSD